MTRPPVVRRRDVDFVKLWTGQSVSVFGSMVTRIALPLTALLALDSSALQQGWLQAAEALPLLGIALAGGMWVDRLRRRPVMIAVDLGRAALVLVVPVAAYAGRLTMPLLYVVAMLMAGCTAVFEAAYQAYVPTLVGRDRLVEANATLSGSAAVAEVAGFSAAGVLVQLLSGPSALLVDAATFVVSALSLARIRVPEPARPSRLPAARTGAELFEGVRLVAGHPVLRALVASATTASLAGGVFAALYMLFAVKHLHLSPAVAGVVAACGGLGSLAGAIGAEPTSRRLGQKATLVLGFGLGGACQCLVPLAHGTPFAACLYLVTAQVLGDGLITMAAVNDTSLRQTLVDDAVLGKVAAFAHALRTAALPLGAIVGGVLGQVAGPRAALAVGAAVFLISPVWIAMAPVEPAATS